MFARRWRKFSINDGKIADQFLRDGVAISQVVDAVRTHPRLLIRTLPDEDFEGQIKCEKRGRNHEWRAAFRIAKDQHVGLLHREADASRFATMVNLGKEGQIAAVDDLLEAFQGHLDSKWTGSAHRPRPRAAFQLSLDRSWFSPCSCTDEGEWYSSTGP